MQIKFLQALQDVNLLQQVSLAVKGSVKFQIYKVAT